MKKRTKKLLGSSRTESGRRLRTRNATLAYFRRHWLFYAMLILPVLYYFLFCYRAMPGVVIAFKNYNMFTGIWDSPWVGMEFFKRVAQSDPFWRSVRNTLVLNILGLVVGFPLPIILALFLNEIMHTGFKKTVHQANRSTAQPQGQGSRCRAPKHPEPLPPPDGGQFDLPLYRRLFPQEPL